MNSHDKGLAYALATPDERQRRQTRQNMVADVADAMANGFKAEPDLSPCHLQLLSDEALTMVFKQSEKWRDKTRERELENDLDVAREELENDLDVAREELAQLSDHYVALRQILGALDVPHAFRSVMGKPQHVAWTEQKARELVSMAEVSEKHATAAKDAEVRMDLLERYVKACDAKRVPYNWNVFKMATAGLHQHVIALENMDKLARCDVNPDRVAWLETRTNQETEQSLRWHVRNAEATRKLIESLYVDLTISNLVADRLLDALLGREQWTVWEWDYKPDSLDYSDTVDIETKDGRRNTLQVSVVDWSKIKRYRRVK